MNEELINKYLSNQISEQEAWDMVSEIKKSDNLFNKVKKYKLWWALFDFAEEDVDIEFDKFKRKNLLKLNSHKQLFKYLKIASVVILLIGTGFLLSLLTINSSTNNYELVFNKPVNISSPQGQITIVILPDSTYVTLNCGSSISYGYDFFRGVRNIKLSGEAFFKVSKDKLHPFQVLVDGLSLKVYGTSFNVRAYPSDPNITTTLVDGSLGVININQEELVKLKSGDQAEFIKSDGKLTVKSVVTEKYTSWQEGIITFRSEELIKIIERIELWYNVEIIVENDLLLKDRYWGTLIKDKPVEQILELLKTNSSIEYKVVKHPKNKDVIYLY